MNLIFLLLLLSLSCCTIHHVMGLCSGCDGPLKELQKTWLDKYFPIIGYPPVHMFPEFNSTAGFAGEYQVKTIRPPTKAEYEAEFAKSPNPDFTTFLGIPGRLFGGIKVKAFADWQDPSHFTDLKIITDLKKILEVRVEFEKISRPFDAVNRVFVDLLEVYWASLDPNTIHKQVGEIRKFISETKENVEFGKRPLWFSFFDGSDHIVTAEEKETAKNWTVEAETLLENLKDTACSKNVLPTFVDGNGGIICVL